MNGDGWTGVAAVVVPVMFTVIGAASVLFYRLGKLASNVEMLTKQVEQLFEFHNARQCSGHIDLVNTLHTRVERLEKEGNGG
jgi:hypothetical protein